MDGQWGRVEHRIESNLFAEGHDQDRVLLDFIMPYVRKLRKNGTLVTFHFFQPTGVSDRTLGSREKDPVVYHWSRFVHMFTNQLGFDIDAESKLCAKQSEQYARISKELGIKW